MISVVIPVYNKGKYISQSIHSVLNQTYSDFELIIIDDGSTDHSLDRIREFEDSRIRVIVQANQGISKSRNRCIAASSSEWIAFLDADDEWSADHLQRLNDLKDKYPGCGLYALSYQLQMPNGEHIAPHIGRLPFQGDDGILTNYYELASGSDFPFNMNCFMVNKKYLYQIGLFPENVPTGEDIFTLGRLFSVCDFAYSVHPTSRYRLEAEGKNNRWIDGQNKLDDAFYQLLEQGRHRPYVRPYVASWYKRRMVEAILHRQYRLGMSFFVRGCRICPSTKFFTSLLISLLSNVSGRSINELTNLFSRRKRI